MKPRFLLRVRFVLVVLLTACATTGGWAAPSAAVVDAQVPEGDVADGKKAAADLENAARPLLQREDGPAVFA